MTTEKELIQQNREYASAVRRRIKYVCQDIKYSRNTGNKEELLQLKNKRRVLMTALNSLETIHTVVVFSSTAKFTSDELSVLFSPSLELAKQALV